MTRHRTNSKSWDSAAVQLLPHNIIMWQGPSRLTGDPIFVIATAKTSNRKIGAMVQLWIIPEMDPIAAVKSGKDDAVCGDCRHRGILGKQRTCYVEWWRSVENIHQFKHKAEVMTPQQFARVIEGEQLRIGAYGDPVAVPLEVWEPMLEAADGWTAYSHQWARPEAQRYRDWCMASVDTPDEQAHAARLGWRTFRVRMESESVQENEVTCPASEEAGHKVVCADCSLCMGGHRQAKHIVLQVHGQSARFFRADELVAAR